MFVCVGGTDGEITNACNLKQDKVNKSYKFNLFCHAKLGAVGQSIII